MALGDLGDDEVKPKKEQDGEKYLLGLTVKETLDMLIRCHHELSDIVTAIRQRVLELELKEFTKDNDVQK